MGFGYLWAQTSFKISSTDIDLCIAYVNRLCFLENIYLIIKNIFIERFLFLQFIT